MGQCKYISKTRMMTNGHDGRFERGFTVQNNLSGTTDKGGHLKDNA